ncbi:MAG: hypothetical protein B7Z78_14010 [Rhodospirillales bacterium 20-60-12]|nr:MAG: hypothetical protein B7Z78_14010 [Rhodospirillales bacterium 20-60-12]HQT68654.1 prepilin peptidase [Acetobacteraceae bacterium]HQU01306.1 prepilin peptidase [Acetobacteraceae bacterium]
MTEGFFMLASWLAILLLLYGAVHDFAARTVPNSLSLALLLIACVIRLLDGNLRAGLFTGLIVFLALQILWLLRLMGGGDVKFWAAAAIAVKPHIITQLDFLLQVVFAGGILAIVYISLRYALPKMKPGYSQTGRSFSLWRRILRAEHWRNKRNGPLPYAAAIAAGGVLSLLTSLTKG